MQHGLGRYPSLLGPSPSLHPPRCWNGQLAAPSPHRQAQTLHIHWARELKVVIGS